MHLKHQVLEIWSYFSLFKWKFFNCLWRRITFLCQEHWNTISGMLHVGFFFASSSIQAHVRALGRSWQMKSGDYPTNSGENNLLCPVPVMHFVSFEIDIPSGLVIFLCYPLQQSTARAIKLHSYSQIKCMQR